MEWIGWVCLIIILCYSGYPNKVKSLERESDKLKKKLKSFERNGENNMSKLISELVGKKCTIEFSESFDTFFDNKVKCTVISVDDEWLKISYEKDIKKGEKVPVTKIVRIDNIESVEISE